MADPSMILELETSTHNLSLDQNTPRNPEDQPTTNKPTRTTKNEFHPSFMAEATPQISFRNILPSMESPHDSSDDRFLPSFMVEADVGTGFPTLTPADGNKNLHDDMEKKLAQPQFMVELAPDEPANLIPSQPVEHISANDRFQPSFMVEATTADGAVPKILPTAPAEHDESDRAFQPSFMVEAVDDHVDAPPRLPNKVVEHMPTDNVFVPSFMVEAVHDNVEPPTLPNAPVAHDDLDKTFQPSFMVDQVGENAKPPHLHKMKSLKHDKGDKYFQPSFMPEAKVFGKKSKPVLGEVTNVAMNDTKTSDMGQKKDKVGATGIFSDSKRGKRFEEYVLTEMGDPTLW